MMQLFRFVQIWKSPTSKILIFFLLLCVACQPAEVPATPIPTQTSPAIPTIPPTSTETAVIPSPTLTEIPSPTAQPTTTGVSIPLSAKGPWLVYKHYYAAANEHFILNQDGTGRVRVRPDCNADRIQENPSNRLVVFPGMVYLFQPSGADWTLVFNEWPGCGSDFTGNHEKGLLAERHSATEAAIPEIGIYELPSGKIRDKIPLVNCSNQNEPCDLGSIEWWSFEMEWSPNGRYLAFSAALEGSSSDLYMYDTQTGNVLRLTSGPDSVSQIWWSPDGKWIIMGELHESNYPFTTSIWAVSAADNEMRQLYSLEDGYPQGILGWLDDRKFIVFGGTSLYDASDLPAYNLDIVDIDTGEITSLFRGSFFTAHLAADPEIIALGVYNTEQEGYQGDGTYLVSVSNPTPRLIGHDLYQPYWDDQLALFVTNKSCEDDPTGRLALDVQGEWQCIRPSLPDSHPSPDGKMKVSIDDGTWLKANDKPPVQIIEENAVQVIWRPDS